MINRTKYLLSATIIGGILLFSPTLGHASDPRSEAIAIANTLTEEQIAVKLRKDPELSAKVELRRRLMDRLVEKNDEDIDLLIAQATKLRLENLDIYSSFADITIFHPDDKAIIKDRTEFLEEQALSTDWHRQYLAYLYLGNHYVFSQNNLVALKYAQNALESIPNIDTDIDVVDARYETYDLLHTAFIVDRNVNKAIDATQKLVEIGNETNRNIDHVAIVHNLAVLFSKARDFETASELSSVLIKMRGNETSWQQAVVNHGHGSNLSEAGKYVQALPFLEKGAELAHGTRLENITSARLALAYAKTKQTRKANEQIQKLLKNAQPGEQSWDRISRILTPAQAEVAFNSGNYKEGYIYLNKWAEERTQELESMLFEDRRRASEGLAMSARVAQEREKRLQYEVEATKQIATRGKVAAIFAGLLAFALTFITFNLNRQRKRQIRINSELAVARDRALAGEKTKSKFLSMMGHELRTPMNPIISLADILYTRSKDPDVKQMLRMISASGRTMLSMVENILIVADETKRKLKLSTQKTKIRDFIRFTCTGFQRDAEEKGVEFILNIDENVPEQMDVDKLKLKSILTNMLSNAVKFTDQGAVYVSALMVNDPRLGVSFLMSVKDTGAGMTQDEIEHLRAVFEQHNQSHTKSYDGVGVGLYVTELYTKAHGGRMAITSHPQDGTRIDVYIPYDMPMARQQAA